MVHVVEHVYCDSDLPALSEALSQWIEAAGPCGYYHTGDLYHWVNDLLAERAARDECLRFWTDDSTIVGFAVCGLFNCAFQVLAHPEWRGGADEHAWLVRAESITQSLMADRHGADSPDRPITDVFDCDTVRRSTLKDLGFQAYRVWDHVNERLIGETVPEPVLPRGFAIRAATAAEAPSLRRLNGIVFGDESDSAVIDATLGDTASSKNQQPRTLVAVSPSGEWAGMATLHLDDRNRMGLFEPVGAHPRFRRLGLARAVMSQGLREMAVYGMRAARVSHDATNVAAAELYRSLGFAQRYTTLGYRRLTPMPGAPSDGAPR